MSDGLQIDFGSIVGGPAEPPAGAADQALVGSGPGQLNCVGLLSTEQFEQAKVAAAKLYPAMLADTQSLASFGNSAVEQLNHQVNRVFREVGRVDIPELTAIMREVNDRMRTFRRKYDPSDPSVRDTFNRLSDAVKGVFRKGRNLLEMLFEEARTVERQLDKISGQLHDKQLELKRNVVLCDELYKANEAAIGQLIGVIAIMELIRDEALSSIVEGQDRDAREKLAVVTEFEQAVEVRINEFQQRLFVAWSTSPQVRAIRSLNYGLGQRLALLINLTIPTMKLTIAQWALMLQADQAAGLQQAVSDGANDVLSAYARSAHRGPEAGAGDPDADAAPGDSVGGRGVDRRAGPGHRGRGEVRPRAPRRGGHRDREGGPGADRVGAAPRRSGCRAGGAGPAPEGSDGAVSPATAGGGA